MHVCCWYNPTHDHEQCISTDFAVGYSFIFDQIAQLSFTQHIDHDRHGQCETQYSNTWKDNTKPVVMNHHVSFILESSFNWNVKIKTSHDHFRRQHCSVFLPCKWSRPCIFSIYMLISTFFFCCTPSPRSCIIACIVSTLSHVHFTLSFVIGIIVAIDPVCHPANTSGCSWKWPTSGHYFPRGWKRRCWQGQTWLDPRPP